jgi:AcrR family transcriptional regulator
MMGRKKMGDQRRREILDALYRCLLRRSYGETSVREIAREAGMNPALIHYYFKSKDDVLLCFVEDIFQSNKQLLEARLQELENLGCSATDLLDEFLSFFNQRITGDARLQKVIFEIWEVAIHNRKIKEMVKKIYREWMEALADLLRRAVPGLEDPSAVATALVALQEGIGIFSVLFGFNKGYTLELLKRLQELLLSREEARLQTAGGDSGARH